MFVVEKKLENMDERELKNIDFNEKIEKVLNKKIEILFSYIGVEMEKGRRKPFIKGCVLELTKKDAKKLEEDGFSIKELPDETIMGENL